MGNNLNAFCTHCLTVIEDIQKHREQNGCRSFIQDGHLIDALKNRRTPLSEPDEHYQESKPQADPPPIVEDPPGSPAPEGTEAVIEADKPL